jgi:hypothetical protein
MAERTPKRLASYEAAQTTERLPRQATMTGLPRSCGSSRCSTDAKNASKSIRTILRTVICQPSYSWLPEECEESIDVVSAVAAHLLCVDAEAPNFKVYEKLHSAQSSKANARLWLSSQAATNGVRERSPDAADPKPFMTFSRAFEIKPGILL